MGFLEKIFGRGQPARVNPRTVGKPGTYQPPPRLLPRGEAPDGRRTNKHVHLGIDDFQRFVEAGEVVAVTSSNVEKAQYDRDTQTLYIWYLPSKGYAGSLVWAYSPYTPAEAAGFIRAPSKGGWLWTFVRVRGEGHVHDHQRDARPVNV